MILLLSVIWGFQWTPHLSRPDLVEEAPALRTLRVGLVGRVSPVEFSPSVDAQATEDAPAEDFVTGEEPDSAVPQGGRRGKAQQPSAPLEHVRQDLDLVFLKTLKKGLPGLEICLRRRRS